MLQPSWISQSAIAGAIARWAVELSPYLCPDGLQIVILQFVDRTAPLFHTGGFRELTSDELDALLDEHLMQQPQVVAWNQRRNGNDAPFAMVSRYGQPEPDDDFIDLHALKRNIRSTIEENSERTQAMDSSITAEIKADAGYGRHCVDELLTWARERKSAEVDQRPDENIYKRTLTETWDQVIGQMEVVLSRIGNEDSDFEGDEDEDFSDSDYRPLAVKNSFEGPDDEPRITEAQALAVVGPLLEAELRKEYRRALELSESANNQLPGILLTALAELMRTPQEPIRMMELLVRLKEILPAGVAPVAATDLPTE